jgi:DNA-binding Lrp family transcriptional regulator
MANARKVKPSPEEQRVEAALREYAARVERLPSVAAVVLVPGPERDLFTYIDARDLDVVDNLMDVEDAIFDLFDEDMFDVHIRYLEGRSLDETRPSTSQMVYQRA